MFVRGVARLIVCGAILSTGCAVRTVGFVEAAGDRVVLMEGDGERHKLAPTEGAAPLAHLDQHMVEIIGRRGLGGIRVVAWLAIEGPHGLPVWAGPVQRRGRQVGIQDLGSGNLVWVDGETAPEMARFVGDLVAAEGYLEQNRLVVLHWRALVDEPSSGTFRP